MAKKNTGKTSKPAGKPAGKTTSRKTTRKPGPDTRRPNAASGEQTNTFALMEEMMTNSFGYEKFSKETITGFQEGSEAIAKSGSLALKGVEDFLKGLSEISRKAADTNANVMKELMECHTLNELTEAQHRVMKTTIEDALENASKLSELSVKAVTLALEPVNTHITKTYRKVGNTFSA